VTAEVLFRGAAVVRNQPCPNFIGFVGSFRVTFGSAQLLNAESDSDSQAEEGETRRHGNRL